MLPAAFGTSLRCIRQRSVNLSYLSMRSFCQDSKKKDTQSNKSENGNQQSKNESSEKNSSKEEEEKARKQREAEIRKEMYEEKETQELRNQLEKSDTSFSTLTQFYKLVRYRLALACGVVGLTVLGFELYNLVEKHTDPVNGEKKILIVNRADERRLSDQIGGIFTAENTQINSTKLLNKIKKVQQLFKKFGKLEFPVNGKIILVDREDMVFFLLANGDLFISKRVAINCTQEELAILIGYELSHIYLRSSTKNIPFSELTTILRMKLSGFSAYFNHFMPLQTLRQYYTEPLRSEQEQNNMIMAADIIDEAGVDIDPDSLRMYLLDIIQKFSSSQATYILDFRRKHPNI